MSNIVKEMVILQNKTTQPNTITTNNLYTVISRPPVPIPRTELHDNIIKVLSASVVKSYENDKPDIIEKSILKVLQQYHTYFDEHNDVYIAGELRRAMIQSAKK